MIASINLLSNNLAPAFMTIIRLEEVHKSPYDKCSYRAIRLESGIEALLIHDSQTDKVNNTF